MIGIDLLVFQHINARRCTILVLTRHVNETIVINHGEIKITVIDIRGDKVRLGVEAAADIPVHRGEVEAAIEAIARQEQRENNRCNDGTRNM